MTCRNIVNIALVCLISMAHQMLYAQKPIKELPISARGEQSMQHAIETTDGCILAVGSTNATRGSGLDVFLVKTDRVGNEVYRKSFGTNELDDTGYAIAELPTGMLLIGGTSLSRSESKQGKTHQAWLRCRTAQAEKVWDRVLHEHPVQSIVQDLYVDAANERVVVAVLRGFELWLMAVAYTGETVFEKRIDQGVLQGLPINAVNLTVGQEGGLYVYGLSEFGPEKRAPFMLQVTHSDLSIKSQPIVFGDYTAHAVGRLYQLSSDHLLWPISLRADKLKSDLGLVRINPSLDKSRAILEKYTPPNDDRAIELGKTAKGELLLYGMTTSHRVGADKHDFFLAQVSQEGKFLNDRKTNPWSTFGNPYQESAVRMLQKADGSLWLCGNRARGTDFGSNSNFYFAQLEKTTRQAIDSTPVKQELKPLIVTLNEKQSTLALPKSTSGYLTVRVENPNTEPIAGMRLRSSLSRQLEGLSIIDEIMLKPLEGGKSVLVTVPVQTKKEIAPSETKVSIEIKDAQLKTLGTTTCDIQLKAPQIVMETLTAQACTKGQLCDLVVKFRNAGNLPAQNMHLVWTVPMGVSIQGKYEQDVKEWAPGQVITCTIKATPSELIATDQMEIRAHWNSTTDEDLHLTALVQIQLLAPQVIAQTPPAQAPIPTPPVQTPAATVPASSTTDALTLLVYWKGDESEESTTFEQVYQIKAAASSVKELSVDHFKVILNGDTISFAGQKFDEVLLTPPQKHGKVFTTTFSKKLQLQPGRNSVEVVVTNEAGATKTEKPWIVNYKPNDKGTLYVVSIGVPDKTGQIKYSQKDANDVADLLQQQTGKFYGEVEITLMTSADSTEAKDITSKVRALVKENERKTFGDRDALVFFLSGHGFIDEDDQSFRIQGSDYDVNAKEQTSVNFDKLVQEIDRLSCQKFVLVDACQNISTDLSYSGAKGDGADYDYSQALEKILKGSRKVKAMSSCSKGEYSFESPEWQNGAFSYVLLKALSDKGTCKALDKNNDKAVSFQELFPHVQTEVTKEVKRVRKGKIQTPNAPGLIDDTPFFFY
jgi:Caspase domain